MSEGRLTPVRIAVLYAVASVAWILLSDTLLASLGLAADVAAAVSVVKGWGFIGVTAVALWRLITATLAAAEAAQAAAVEAARREGHEARILRLAVGAEQVLLRASSEQDLYEGICSSVVAADPRLRLVWIGRVEPDAAKAITIAAAAGDAMSYLHGITVTWDDSPTGRGPSGTSVREGVTVVANDIATDPRLAPWRERQLAHGIRASAAVPIAHEGERVAVLTLYSDERDAFTPSAVEALERLAIDVAFGITALRAGIARDRATRAERRAACRLEILHEIDRLILDAGPIVDLERHAADVVRQLLEATRVSVMTFEGPGADAMRVIASDEDPAQPSDRVLAPVAQVFTTPIPNVARPVLFATAADILAAMPRAASQVERGISAAVLLPLVDGAAAQGALVCFGRDRHIHDSEAIAVAEEIAGQLSIALRQDRFRRELADREARLRAILDGSPNPILTVNAGGIIDYASPATATVFGGTVADFVGRPVADLVPEPLATNHARLVAEWFAGGMPQRDHPLGLEGRRIDGSTVPIQALLAPHPTPDGPRAIVTVVDLTERVRIEARLRQSERLETLGQFAGILAHDVRNFFSAISWSSDLLLADLADDDPKRRDMQLIQDAVTQGIAMTQSVLEFARPSRETSGETDVAHHLAQVSGVIRRILADGQDLQVEAEAGLPLVPVAGSAMTQVLLNLATNARDAMPAGGTFRLEARTIEVAALTRATSVLAPGRYVRIVASDTGVGMDTATAEHVFEPFFTTKTDGATAKGTGLGLASVFLIVSRAGGAITLETEEGRGTRFVIDLPAVA